ncbi:response regulator [Clostridium sp. PL3]|uniref:Circadian input-output histidine kinase CikA n=1 Tax=Clostridium thailandense TaxID=2794346 RepID=A0A949TVI7_9CLOT|nr:ATP-binding protein [Clostridium thailandense]MBV7271753.1 response regulator [Clostridium thailandense]
MSLTQSAYFGDPLFFALVILKMVNISLKYGNSKESSYAFAAYALLLCGKLENYAVGYEFGKLAILMNKKFKIKELDCKIFFITSAFVNIWCDPLNKSILLMKKAYEVGKQYGDFNFSNYSISFLPYYMMISGLYELQEVVNVCDEANDFSLRLKNYIYYERNMITKTSTLSLMGLTDDKASLNYDDYIEFDHLKKLKDMGANTQINYYNINKISLLYFYGEYIEGLKLAEETESLIVYSPGGTYLNPQYYLYYSLLITSSYESLNKDKQMLLMNKLKVHRSIFQKWVEICPQNFNCNILLIDAEIARISKNFLKAMDLYDEAIRDSEENGFKVIEALANELAAKFHLSFNRKKIAISYLEDAIVLYEKWGAKGKVRYLIKSYRYLLEEKKSPYDSGLKTIIKRYEDISTTNKNIMDILDAASLIKASQAISSEMIFDKLIEKLMNILIENAGAQYAFLMLEDKNELCIHANVTLNNNIEIILKKSINYKAEDLPESIINYVRRTEKEIILNAVNESALFSEDLYIINNQPQSILCIPIREQAKVIGVLYLENKTIKNIFTAERLQILKILVSQAVVSIRNSLNYEEIKSTKEEYSNLFENIQDVFYRTDLEGKVILASPSCENLLGYTREEIINKDIEVFYKYPEQRKNMLKILEEKNYVENFEQQIICKDGTIKWASTNTHYYRDKEGNILGIEGMIRDVNEQKIMEEYKIAKESAEAATKTKSEFLANMSHEIRTPMNVIIGFTNLVLKTDLSAKQLDYINKIKSSSKNLLGIINDILDFSKIEAGKLELESINFNLKDVISSTVAMIQMKAIDKGLRLICDISEDIPCYLNGDHLRLQQILMNLLNNSIKFTETGSILIKASLLYSNEKNCKISFSVKDTGIGITKDLLPKLFTPFSQADTSITRKYGGTGLGLTICKNLVNMMNGDIEVESEYGVGSIFTFTLEFNLETEIKSNDNLKVDKTLKRIELKKHIKAAKVLLVEDVILNQKFITELLHDTKLIVDIANNGKEALKAITASNYDIILMDIQMPIMDGYEATRIIRKDSKFAQLPIIAMTANAMEGTKEDCLKAGMNDYISKPIDIDQLFLILNSWIKSESKDSSKDILHALDISDMDTAKFLAHTLKGVASNISAYKINEFTSKLHSSIINKNKPEAYRFLYELDKQLKLTINSIKSLEKIEINKSTIDKTFIDKVKIESILKKLEKLLKEDSPDSEFCLEDLKNHLEASMFYKELEEIEKYLNRYDFDGAIQILKKIFKSLKISTEGVFDNV